MRPLLLSLALLLAGCAESTTAIWQTVKEAVGRPSVQVGDPARLDLRYRYLRVTHESGVSILVLGFVDGDDERATEVWYAVDGEIVRLQNGRLAGNTGLAAQWRSVALPELPAWPALAAEDKPVTWERTRDVMPGYRYGVHDVLVLSRIATPRSSALIGLDPQKLVWFEERTAPGSEEKLPPARYAVEGDRVVYGEQCVSPASCFRWQRWPAGS